MSEKVQCESLFCLTIGQKPQNKINKKMQLNELIVFCFVFLHEDLVQQLSNTWDKIYFLASYMKLKYSLSLLNVVK